MPRSLPWFRLYTEARTDKKLAVLTLAERGVWLNLLCYAAEAETRGTFDASDRFALAIECADADQAILEAALDKLVKVRHVIDLGNGRMAFRTFHERQQVRDYRYPSEEPEAVRARVAKSRAQAKQQDVTSGNDSLQADVTSVTSVTSGNESVTTCNDHIEIERENTDRERDRETDANASAAVASATLAQDAPSPEPEPVAVKPAKREPRYSREEQCYVAKLLDVYKDRLRVKRLSAEGKERAAGHFFYRAGPDGDPVPVDVVLHVYDLMKGRFFWRGKLLSLQKVAEQFPEYANDPVAFAADGGPVRPVAYTGVAQVSDDPVTPLPASAAPPEPPSPPRRVFHLAGYRDGAKVWRAVADELRRTMTRPQFDTSFGSARFLLPPKQATAPPAGDTPPVPTLVLHSAFGLELVTTRYGARIEQAFQQVAPQIGSLRMVCAAEVDMSAPTPPAATAEPALPSADENEPPAPPMIALSAHWPRSTAPDDNDDTPKGA